MKKYVKPNLEVVELDVQDIVMASTTTTSGCLIDGGYNDSDKNGAASSQSLDYYS
ncbi:MAG: hypothetical protein IJ002_04015 [Clostridia bacterium]|nr:hypothetical protein [Clostridia bacterium]